MIQQMLAMWSLVPLTLLNPAWTSGISQFTYYWRFTWRILSISLVSCEMSAIVQKFEHSLALHFFGIGMKTDLFQSCGHSWVFQICWHVECSIVITSSFRIWSFLGRAPRAAWSLASEQGADSSPRLREINQGESIRGRTFLASGSWKATRGSPGSPSGLNKDK